MLSVKALNICSTTRGMSSFCHSLPSALNFCQIVSSLLSDSYKSGSNRRTVSRLSMYRPVSTFDFRVTKNNNQRINTNSAHRAVKLIQHHFQNFCKCYRRNRRTSISNLVRVKLRFQKLLSCMHSPWLHSKRAFTSDYSKFIMYCRLKSLYYSMVLWLNYFQ